jgi:hypothetical protein
MIEKLIVQVASWLRGEASRRDVQGGAAIVQEFDVFSNQIPALCNTSGR